jgi:dihydrofolate reductase
MNIIVARNNKNGIGINNLLPWHCPEDMKHFTNTTRGKVVVMGSNTFKSIGYKPLPNRTNVILTRNPESVSSKIPEGVNLSLIVMCDEDTVLSDFNHEGVFIIGGESVYKQFLPFCKRVYLTQIDDDNECDTFFEIETSQYHVESVFKLSEKAVVTNYVKM